MSSVLGEAGLTERDRQATTMCFMETGYQHADAQVRNQSTVTRLLNRTALDPPHQRGVGELLGAVDAQHSRGHSSTRGEDGRRDVSIADQRTPADHYQPQIRAGSPRAAPPRADAATGGTITKSAGRPRAIRPARG